MTLNKLAHPHYCPGCHKTTNTCTYRQCTNQFVQVCGWSCGVPTEKYSYYIDLNVLPTVTTEDTNGR